MQLADVAHMVGLVQGDVDLHSAHFLGYQTQSGIMAMREHWPTLNFQEQGALAMKCLSWCSVGPGDPLPVLLQATASLRLGAPGGSPQESRPAAGGSLPAPQGPRLPRAAKLAAGELSEPPQILEYRAEKQGAAGQYPAPCVPAEQRKNRMTMLGVAAAFKVISEKHGPCRVLHALCWYNCWGFKVQGLGFRV